MNFKYVVDIEVENIDHGDCPDYVDAYIASAAYPKLGWVLGWLYNLIPHSRKTVRHGMTCIHPRFFKLRRFLGSLIYRECTEDEINKLNEDQGFVYEHVMKRLY